ncbi:hypothetical protein AB0M68_19050 [Streptomyces sp. NPDC051453]|uniref:hypothetical protein n=1 Tax=Streptomyces sp. NPDC051453 TaxID=3154941 RepID=UPI00343EF611
MGQNRWEFDGWIAGAGTASGIRMVLGHWPRSPFGAFSDVMVEGKDGTRLLLAPTDRTADFIASTYTFDDVRVEPVTVHRSGPSWTVLTEPLTWQFVCGPRGVPGQLLSTVPAAMAAHPTWIRCAGLPARLLGLRTHGSARGGRHEFYGVRDLRPLIEGTARWENDDLGPITPAEPPVRFGSVSVPKHPSLVRVTTTVELPSRH